MKLVSDLAAWTPLSSRILQVDQPVFIISSGTGENCEFLWLKKKNEEQRLAKKEQAHRPPLAELHQKPSDLINFMRYFRGPG